MTTSNDVRSPMARIEGNSLLLSSALHMVASVLGPVMLWDSAATSKSTVLWWAAAQIALALVSIAGVLFQRRGVARPFHFCSKAQQIGALLSFLVLPWLSPAMTSESPTKYVTMLAYVAVTAISGSYSSHITQHRPAFVRDIVVIGVCYAAAFLVQSQWLFASLVVLWTLTISALTRIAYVSMAEVLAMHEATKQSARHDDLTGLLSRAAFLDDLAKPNHSNGALALFDLDGFKAINDAFGHPAGDAVLRAIADRLNTHLPPGASIGRLGGDEFAARLQGSPPTIATTIERVLNAIAEPITFDERDLYVAASAGWTLESPTGSPAELMAQADAAMYESKKSETVSSTSFDISLRDKLNRSLDLRQRFRSGLRQREIEYWAQPLVRTSDCRPVAIEVLARWRQPDGSYVPPLDFTRVADETGLAVELDRQALAAARDILAAWQDDAVLSPIKVKVNISPVHLHNGALTKSIQELVPAVHRQRLGLEFVESRLIAAAERNHEQMRELLDMGIMLSIDDFGVGYSSLAYLRTLPVSELKIDRSFITNVNTDRVNQGLVRAIVDIASALGLPTVAEGIEREAELAEVTRLGVTIGQGFYLSHPVPLEDADALIKGLHR